MISQSYGQPYVCTFYYHHRHYNQRHAAWPRHLFFELVYRICVLFHQYLYRTILDFPNRYTDQCTSFCLGNVHPPLGFGNLSICLWMSIPPPSISFLSVLYFSFGQIFVDNWSRAFSPSFFYHWSELFQSIIYSLLLEHFVSQGIRTIISSHLNSPFTHTWKSMFYK